LISELGYDVATVPYSQSRRTRGITKNNFYTLYDLAMLGITNHSKVPLRLATMAGFALSAVSLFLSLLYLIGKLFFWQRFEFGPLRAASPRPRVIKVSLGSCRAPPSTAGRFSMTFFLHAMP